MAPGGNVREPVLEVKVRDAVPVDEDAVAAPLHQALLRSRARLQHLAEEDGVARLIQRLVA
eukprot:2634926-Alexandrium_andersonii.AAC.1